MRLAARNHCRGTPEISFIVMKSWGSADLVDELLQFVLILSSLDPVRFTLLDHTGRRTITLVPFPSSLVRVRVPPCSSTMRRDT